MTDCLQLILLIIDFTHKIVHKNICNFLFFNNISNVNISNANISNVNISNINISNLIYKAQNIYIYIFIPYRNPNCQTDLGEIWHRNIF